MLNTEKVAVESVKQDSTNPKLNEESEQKSFRRKLFRKNSILLITGLIFIYLIVLFSYLQSRPVPRAFPTSSQTPNFSNSINKTIPTPAIPMYEFPNSLMTAPVQFVYIKKDGIYLYKNGKSEKIVNDQLKEDYRINYNSGTNSLYWLDDKSYFSYDLTTKKTSQITNSMGLRMLTDEANFKSIYTIFSANQRGGVWLYDFETSKEEKILDSTYELSTQEYDSGDCYIYTRAKISPDGKKFAVTKSQCGTEIVGDVEIFDLFTRKIITTFNTNNKSILGWSDDSNNLFLTGCNCYQSEPYLGKIRLDNNTIEKISSDSFNLSVIDNDQIVYLDGEYNSLPKTGILLKMYDDKSRTSSLLFDKKLDISGFSVNKGVDKILLKSDDPSNIYLLDVETKEVKLLVEDAGSMAWITE